MPDNCRLAQRGARASRKPQVPGHRGPREHQRADWHAPRNVEERRVPSFVGCHIGPGKPDRVRPTVVVDREVGKSAVARAQNPALDEFRLQHAVAPLPRHIVHAVLGQVEFPRDQPQAAVGLAGSRKDHRTVFVTVARKQVLLQIRVQPRRYRQPPRSHVGLFIHLTTFNSFNAAVSVSGFSLLDLREIWIAG